MLMVEREVGVVPIAQNAQALEALALQVDVLDGELVAELADLGRGGLVELLGAHLGLDLVLDRLAVAVPTGHVRGLITLHGLVAVDHVLGDLVHRVTQVDRAVGVGRTVVQDELLVALVLLEHELVHVVLLPALETLRLALRQGRPHGELGLGQVHGLLVLVCHEYPSLLWAHEKSARPSSSWDEAPMNAGSRPACVSLYHPAQRFARSRSPRTRLVRNDDHPGDAYWARTRRWGRGSGVIFDAAARTRIAAPRALFAVRARPTRPHQRLCVDMIARRARAIPAKSPTAPFQHALNGVSWPERRHVATRRRYLRPRAPSPPGTPAPPRALDL